MRRSWRPHDDVVAAEFAIAARTSPIDDGSMIATIDVADIGIRSTLRALRRRPTPIDVPGLRWLDIAPTVPLSSKRPPGLRQAVLLAMWDDEDAAASFADTHPLAQRFADNGFHAVLRPLRAFGAWPGLPDAVPRTEGDAAQRARDRHDARSAADEPDASVPPSQQAS